MKLFQTIAIFDVVVAADTEEDARNTLANWVHGYQGTQPQLTPSEITGREIRAEREIRTAMLNTKPLVGELLSDEDFEKVKGKTNLELFEEIYTKRVNPKK